VIWYAPDQCFASRSTTVLPFFGAPQTVSTATSRLARASGAAVIPFAYRRSADDSGYVLRFEPALEDVGTDDDEAGTSRLLEVLERFIRDCPAQYAWTHRRLKHRPADLPDEQIPEDASSAVTLDRKAS
jgi:KDO2-lipid IV(A) lauroyltransferase